MDLEMEKQRMEFEMKRREADRQHEMNMWAMPIGRGFFLVHRLFLNHFQVTILAVTLTLIISKITISV